MIRSAAKDGRNCAFLLQTMRSGICVFIHVFEALESNYGPFSSTDFRENFYREVSG